jgi:exodeoxyribonuclease VII large subunit
MERKVYSVSQINRYIKSVFTSDYTFAHIYLKGEVSNCKYHTSGHIYFTLKDSKSQIPCVMFSGQRAGLTFRLTEGQSVVVLGSINVYERDGRYQLYAQEIIPDGIGILYQRFEELRRQLEEEGLFSEIYKKPIPAYCGRIGIVTAKTGAAVQDIINIAHRRNPFAQLILYPSLVQGEGAKESIIKGIRTLDEMGCDVLIVGRGGGSLEDLWAFNEECVVRAVFECNTPIISAVGHETDTTLTDYAADLRAPTPSAAAELATVDIRALLYTLEEYKLRINRKMISKITKNREQLSFLSVRLSHASPQYALQQNIQYLADSKEKMRRLLMEKLKERRQELALLTERLHALTPVERLKGGYAYVTIHHKPLSSVAQVKEGSKISVTLRDGTIEAEVTDKKEDDIFTDK